MHNKIVEAEKAFLSNHLINEGTGDWRTFLNTRGYLDHSMTRDTRRLLNDYACWTGNLTESLLKFYLRYESQYLIYSTQLFADTEMEMYN